MMGGRGASPALVALLLAASLAGCIGTDDPSEAFEASATEARVIEPIVAGHAINESRLTEPIFDVLPKLVEYVEATTDGVELYTEIHLPDGQGPWPTILESSPYRALAGNGKLDELFGTGRLVDHYVPRGYAVVFAHVRGTGNSEGCMDMMGAKEQADQHDLVEWIAGQPWSDGKVAMHGVSYVGTTPHEAAITAPEHLTTVVTIAGVTNQWRNTFMNGVPYDGRHYPLTYELLVGAPPPFDVERGPDWAINTAMAACDQEEAIAHMSPGTYEHGIYDAYWAERNLTLGAGDVQVPILYSQGFADRAVNPSEAVHWFNELDVPKKAFLHQAGHQYAPREDYFTVEHAWMDHWLKGIENGVLESPPVEVQLNDDRIRLGTHWPPEQPARERLHLATGELTPVAPSEGEESYRADMARNAFTGPDQLDAVASLDGTPTELAWTSQPLEDPIHLAGQARMHLVASVDAENTYFLFDLYDVAPDGAWTWLAEGWFNAHLREGFEKSAPLTPGQAHTFDFVFEAREWVLQEGHSIALMVHGHDDRVFPIDEPVTHNTIHYGQEGSWLELPVVEDPVIVERPDDV